MIEKTFERTIRQLCEDILSEPAPEALKHKIIRHLSQTFPVQGSTLWLTEEKGVSGARRLRLAAADGDGARLLTVENGEPAVYEFGEGLTGDIAQRQQTVNIKCYEDFSKYRHARKYDRVTYPANDAATKCRCVLGVPLLLKSSPETETNDQAPWRVIGVLKLENIAAFPGHPETHFTARDVEVVEAYAAVIAVALEKAQMRADSIRIGAGLLDVSRSLLAELGESPNFDEIVRQTARAISAEACSLWLRSGLQLRLHAAYGYHGEKNQVPPYSLETTALTSPGGQTTENPNARYAGVGLTVYVGQSGSPVNLKTAAEIRRHFAWKGANDKLMWDKPHGDACSSLVAIPLIDTEIMDLKGVFKIENKRPTLFQLQSYFTKDDQQLLTILGNSISLSLVISERIDRLRRLDRLVGDVRLLYDINEALVFILTGLTHRDGLQYNRAMIFLIDPARPTKLVCRHAVGQIDPADWQVEMDLSLGDGPLDFDLLLEDFRNGKKIPARNPMLERWLGREIDISDQTTQIIARRTVELNERGFDECKTTKHLSGDLGPADMLHDLARGDYVLIPITFEKHVQGIIYADNRFTGNRVNRFECHMLDLFGGMAAAMIQASGVPAQLKKERDTAWESFSRPAAHRIGTDVGIIDREALHYIMRELQDAPRVADGRLAIHGEVVRKRLQVIKQAVNRLRLAARDYQRLSCIEEAAEDFDLCELIARAVKNTTSNFEAIQVQTRCLGEPVMVHATRGGITYLFEELLINAWKEVYFGAPEMTTPAQGEISVLIEVTPQPDRVVCTVSDNGKGIPPGVQSVLFRQPKSGRHGGTGLGLYLCGQIAARNGGALDLSLEEKPAGYGGASFTITLPLARRECHAQAVPMLLIVEDSPVQRVHLSQHLAENGFASETVSNEDEALQYLATSPHPKAIIADINLSEAGGQRTGGIILAEKMTALGLHLPVILISMDPWYHLPPEGSPKFAAMQREFGIHAVLDRLNASFYDELLNQVKALMRGS